jgi:hypothetical protein
VRRGGRCAAPARSKRVAGRPHPDRRQIVHIGRPPTVAGGRRSAAASHPLDRRRRSGCGRRCVRGVRKQFRQGCGGGSPRIADSGEALDARRG